MTGIRIQNHCIFFNGGSFPSTLQAAGMLILLESFLSPGIFPLSPSFFFDHLVPHVCPSIWHIEHSRASLWNPRYFEKVTCLSVLQGLFLLLCNFYMNLNTQNSWPHWLSTYSWQFLPAITFMWSDWQIQEWPQFFQQQCCASALLSQFQWRYYFSKSPPRYSAVFESWLHWSYDPLWKLQSCALPCWFQLLCHFSKPPPQVKQYITILALTITLPIVDFLSLHFTKLINNIHDCKFGQWNGIFLTSFSDVHRTRLAPETNLKQGISL